MGKKKASSLIGSESDELLLFFVLLITVNAKHLLDIDNCLEPVDTETAASYFSERGFKSSG